ncbi:MAG TPA: Uma2 family endonuclease, partial [Segetibacter sp.]
MGKLVKILPHYTYDDWINWEGQWELIDGIPYAMSPMPVPKHQTVASNLTIEFGNELKKCKSCKIYQPLDYKISDDIIIQPDLLIVCGKIEKKYLDFPPALVIEILSPATALKDKHSKFH